MKTENAITCHAAIGNENTLTIGYFIVAKKRSIEIKIDCENVDFHYAVESLVLAGYDIKKIIALNNETGELLFEMKS